MSSRRVFSLGTTALVSMALGDASFSYMLAILASSGARCLGAGSVAWQGRHRGPCCRPPLVGLLVRTSGRARIFRVVHRSARALLYGFSGLHLVCVGHGSAPQSVVFLFTHPSPKSDCRIRLTSPKRACLGSLFGGACFGRFVIIATVHITRFVP